MINVHGCISCQVCGRGCSICHPKEHENCRPRISTIYKPEREVADVERKRQGVTGERQGLKQASPKENLPANEDELDEILKYFYLNSLDLTGTTFKATKAEAKTQLLAWRNKYCLELLGKIDQEAAACIRALLFTNELDTGRQDAYSNIRDFVQALRAEQRGKLKPS